MTNKLRGAVLACALLISACVGSTDTSTTSPGSADSTATETPIPTASSSTSLPVATTLPSVPADMIFVGGPIITMDSELGVAEGLAVVDDRILAVGSRAEIERYRGPDTVVVELDGRAVLPGFVDPHSHVLTDMGPFEEAQDLALAAGMTSVGDASVESDALDLFLEVAGSGDLRIRTTAYLVRIWVCGEDQGLWYEAYAPGQVLGDRLRVGGVKIFADGGVCRALATSEPILEGYESTDLYFDASTLADYIRPADEAGYQVIVHAQGDVAVATVLDAFESVLDGRPNELRHRIEHSAIQNEATLPRYGELGVIPVVFAPSAACLLDSPWTDFYKAYGERPGDLVRANPDLVIAWHGDDPGVPPLSPIIDLFALVTRGGVAGDGSICEPADWMRGGEVSVERGLRMMTIDAAYAIGQEDQVGSLVPGKLADLVVLSDNILAVDPYEIPGISVLETIIGGQVEYCAPGADDLCPGEDPGTAAGGGGITASLSRAGHSPEVATDGDLDTFWSSGADAPQWLMVDLDSPSTVTVVRLVVYQNPPGDTTHVLEVLDSSGTWEAVQEFVGFTETGQVLEWVPAEPVPDVVAVRVTTVSSPSWPEWLEIEVETG